MITQIVTGWIHDLRNQNPHLYLLELLRKSNKLYKGKKMVTNIFVNLPVKNLAQSIEFFSKLGFTFNPQFTDDSATCMIIGNNIYAMLLVEERFQGFSPKPISNAKEKTEVLLALALENRAQVAEMVEKAVAAGGRTYSEPMDHGFMLQHGFEDLDGHIWEVFFMDPSHVQQ